MIRMRLVLLGLMAVLAISAVAAASASAAPLFKPSTKQSFTGLQLGKSFLEVNGLEKIECTHGSTAGQIVSAALVGNVVVKFTTCTSLIGTCTTSGATSGEIRTNTLHGELGETAKESGSATNVAVLGLLPESGKTQTSFSCGSEPFTVKGGTICAVEPLGVPALTGKESCVQSGGKQKYTAFDGSENGKNNAYHPETLKGTQAIVTSGEQATYDITYEKAVEVT
jgi:hypothetical protein